MANPSHLVIIGHMPADDSTYRRFFAYQAARGITDADIARKTGIPASRFSEGRTRGVGLDRHWPKVAESLELNLNWLLLGKGHPDAHTETGTHPVIRESGVSDSVDPSIQDVRRPDHNSKLHGPLAFVGSVGAGPGVQTYFENPKAFSLRPTLALMRVHGDSAYPVAYDGQFVIVDLDREIRHNNLVVIRTKDGNSHLKRYCVAPDAPDGFVLASVNSGVNTPYIPKSKIQGKMWPVVGVLFEEEPKE